MTSDQQSSSPNDGNGGAPADDEKKPDSGPPEGETDALKAERDRFREQLMRTAADFDNFRKRTKRDLEDAKHRGRDDVIRELLPVFDNLERAVQSSTAASDVRSVIDGVRMVLKMFEDTAERIGLSRVKTVGERFDPNSHEALQQVESGEHPPGTIVAEITAGYRVGERLVRPAMVVVARKPPESKPAPKPEPGAANTAAGGEAPRDAKASTPPGAEPSAGTAVSPNAETSPGAAGSSPAPGAGPAGKQAGNKETDKN